MNYTPQGFLPSGFERFSAPQVYLNSRLEDGRVVMAFDPANPMGVGDVHIGICPLSDAEATVRRITRDVFSEEFLKSIHMWQPTSAEVLDAMHLTPLSEEIKQVL